SLVVQNVSEAAIRLVDTIEAADLRALYIKRDGKIVAAFGDNEPSRADVVLQPREIAFLRVFPADSRRGDTRTTGSILAESTLQDTHQTMFAELKIEHPPAGAWAGKLVTGETSGAVAAGRP